MAYETETERRAYGDTLTFNEVRSYAGAQLLTSWNVPVIFIDKDGKKHNIKLIDIDKDCILGYHFVLKEK